MKDFLKTVLASAFGFLLGSIIFTGLIFVFIVGASIIFMMNTTSTSDHAATSVQDKSILFLNVEGNIDERQTSMDFVRDIFIESRPQSISLFELNETLVLAAKDKKIKGIYLRLRWTNSGWGKVNAARKMLAEFKKSKKFIYAYSEAYDEKLYYLSTVADRIYMYPKGDFQWDGLDSQSMFFKKTFEKLEVEPTLVRAGKFKSAGESFIKEKMSDENRQQVEAITKDLWAHIENNITASRKMLPVEKLENWATNVSITSAQSAYNSKLVDLLAPVEEVEKELKKKTGIKADEEVRLIAWNQYYGLKKPKASFISKKPKVAVIVAEGEIHSGTGPAEQAIYSDDLSSLIRELNKDEEIKGVVLRINSPGGSALASDVIWRSLEYLKKNKTLVSSFSDVAASGGYYIAAGSHYIYADPMTITGSIGVFGLMFNTGKFFENKLGLTFDGVKTHPSSDMMSGVRPMTPYELNVVQTNVNDIYHTFVSVVKQGRPNFEDIEGVIAVAEGRVWSGVQAKQVGLIDAFGGLEQAIQKTAELAKLKDFDVVLYPQEKKIFDRFFESLGGVSLLPEWIKVLFHRQTRQFESIYFTRMPYDYSF
jgi:protease IV